MISCTNCETINDENNNNFSKCEHVNQEMIIVPDISSDDDDDEYSCSTCSSVNDSELISLDTKKLWHDIAHLIKCIYRETHREFTENHSEDEICKAKEYVQILTQINSESLFNKIESIVLEYVDEIRNQVLKRFQTSLKTSNDVQLFISYLLDEYNTFIQAAKNISTILFYLEENYMKSFHLTWLLYNKHLYEKLIYMDKKIQHSMSTMIDLLQPSNDDTNNYSPAEDTHLLNRFLEFDEEMSEIACVYKDCQTKMNSISKNIFIQNGIVVATKKKKKKICKKLIEDNSNSTTTNAVNIPSVSSQQGSNGSSIGSGVGGKESSSISSFDEYLNNTSSSSYTKEESDHNTDELFHDILNNISIKPQIQQEMNDKKSKSSTHRRKETSLTPDLIFPPKPPSSISSKLQADLRSLTIPSLTKIQSVSFTAGTFASITTDESSRLAAINQGRLNINLSRKLASTIKTDSTFTCTNFDQFLHQIPTSLNNKNCDFCSCECCPDSSNTNDCITCMSISNSTMINCAFNLRDAEAKQRLKLKINKRTIQNISDQSNSSIENKTKIKPYSGGDNNIDDLVRFIDGNETTSDNKSTSKKNKKKKTKQIQQKKSDTSIENVIDNSQPLSKRKQKTKLKLEQQEKLIEEIPAIQPVITPQPTPSLPKKIDSIQTNIEPSCENSSCLEEEINWITISRKQSKHKSTPISSAPVNTKQKRQQTNIKAKTPIPAQQKVTSEVISNSNKQHNTNIPAIHVQNPVNNQPKQKIESSSSSAWSKHEETQGIDCLVKPSSTLLATAPVFIPSSSLVQPNKTNDILPIEDTTPSSSCWNSNDYRSSNPVQRPISSFLPAPGPPNTTISRCIRRPSTELRTTTFPTYSPMNYARDNSNSTWNDIPVTNSNQFQWEYSHDEQQPQTSTIPNDFPLYDPFNSNTGLNISSSTILTHIQIPQVNDVDEMDALDKEIEDFKKCYIDPCFIRQS
ncbi:unnamed protein product [Adineta steineri]|uniref:Uncharacterized protein n=4 Tax=Adineta steineri TaxID=433720 RepID=A0A819M652_9BILA|nr:unnamed protein product [Adineta steineri]